MNNLFTYGSLMFPEVWGRVVDGRYRSQGATLRGFVRRQVRGETYPAIVPGAAGSCLEGVLYHGILPHDLARLDRFEGDCYVRTAVGVLSAAGSTVDAFAYVLKEEYRHILSAEEWDDAAFEKEGMRLFLSGYCGFDR
jgi:gamma-glutamylcyclotransferase (GGCT)/AIG2-like uncharacterized protein YtfP